MARISLPASVLSACLACGCGSGGDSTPFAPNGPGDASTGGSSTGGSSTGGSSTGGSSTGGSGGAGGAADASTGGSKSDAGGPDATGGTCSGKADGALCDGDHLITCAAGSVSKDEMCGQGCEVSSGTARCKAPDPTFCNGKANGLWCDHNDLVECKSDAVSVRTTCESGCKQNAAGSPDECNATPFCTTVPPQKPSTPESQMCDYMDWYMSDDGFYLVSQFGTTADNTTMGHTTSCGYLQQHYDSYGCRYDEKTKSCLDSDFHIPWVQGNVDYSYDTVISTVKAHMNEDVPAPEYFYVACGQRFNCGTLLRVTNSENSRCVVVYTEDGGPGSAYEAADKAGRRILDSSPAIIQYLQISKVGWASSTMMYVEWGLPGDKPGMKCSPCESSPATPANDKRSPYDIEHMRSTPCRQ